MGSNKLSKHEIIDGKEWQLPLSSEQMNYRKSRIVLLVLVVVAGFGAGQMLSGGVDLSKGAELPTREIVGVVDAAGGLPLISPIGIVSVFGDFARATTVGMSIPLNLDYNGFSVKFDGKPGALFGSFDASLDQANVQVPVDLDVSDGMVEVEIELEEDSGKGGMSTTFEVPAALASPGIFEFPPATGQAIVTNFSLGNDDVIAGSWAQRPGSVPVAAQPAAVGGVITIWCTGLGPVDQQGSLETGNTPPAGALVTDKKVRVLIGGVEATVLGSVLQGTSVGLYQINAFVPEIELSTSDPITIAEIVIEVDCDDETTIASREGMTIAVREAPAPPPAG